MKKTMIILALSLPFGAFAKVADFNALIRENSAAQKELHKEVRANVDEGRLAVQEDSDRSSTLADRVEPATVNVRSGKNLLRFKKEIVDHQAEQKDLERRLANEFKSSDLEF